MRSQIDEFGLLIVEGLLRVGASILSLVRVLACWLLAHLARIRVFLQAVVGRFAAARVVVVVAFSFESKLYSANVAADVEFLWPGRRMVVLRVPVPALRSALITLVGVDDGRRWRTPRVFVGLEDDGVHAVDRPASLALPGEEFLTSHGTCYDVADQRIPLGQVRREVHLLPEAHRSSQSARTTIFDWSVGDLPFVFLFYAEAGEAEIGAD